MSWVDSILSRGTRENARGVLVVFAVLFVVYALVLVAATLVLQDPRILVVARNAGPLENRWVAPGDVRTTLTALGDVGRTDLARSMIADVLYGAIFAFVLVTWIAYAVRRLRLEHTTTAPFLLLLPPLGAVANVCEDVAVARLVALYPEAPWSWVVMLDVSTVLKVLSGGLALGAIIVLLARRPPKPRT